MSLLPWHEALAARIRERRDDGTLPHGMLITAHPGWGEREFANWLALFLLDVDTTLDAMQVAHPDLRWLEPDGAEIKVDAVRDLAAFAVGTPQAGRCKVAVLMDAHALNPNAGNALLKTLEEPPAGTHLLLISGYPGRLLPTVRSRCQEFRIAPDRGAARRWLAANLPESVPEAELELRLLEHGGAPVATLQSQQRGERPLEALLADALSAQHAGSAALAQALLEQDMVAVTGRWHHYLGALLSGEHRLEALATVPARRLLGFADELIWVRRQLVTSNSANARLLTERLLACWEALARRD